MIENQYKRELDSSILGIYFGKDEEKRHSLLIKLKNKPKISINSKLLQTKVSIRSDQTWALQVSLTGEKYLGVFRILVKDLVNSVSKETTQAIAERKIVQRYNEWQDLFDDKASKKLGDNAVQGLIGELYFIEKVLFNKYGIEPTIRAWLGPISGNKDFQFEDKWYEVKTKSMNKDIIHISNQSQLEATNRGFLIVINCEKTSRLLPSSFSAIKLHEKIINQIFDFEIEKMYLEKLARLGFIPSDEYEEPSFDIHSISYYLVDDNFPRLLEKPNHYAIVNTKYDLYVPNIEKFRVEVE